MRIVITGASGNLGTSVVRLLAQDQRFHRVVGLSRRRPSAPETSNVSWQAVDITRDELVPHLRGADAVVHLAWLIQPTRDPGRLWEANVRGSRRILAAVADADVPVLVSASSIGAYSPGPAGPARVGEDWPTDGIGSSTYAQCKAYVERCLDAFEREHPAVRVVRIRPALMFKREASDRVRRLFLGGLFPPSLLDPGRLPLLPMVRRLTFQAVHTDDVADACRSALLREVAGAFNLAAEPILSLRDVAAALGSRPVTVPAGLVRPTITASWMARLQPIDPGWFDLAPAVPKLQNDRARDQLGWQPSYDAREALAELLDGIRHRQGGSTPPLTSRYDRARELATGRQGAAEVRP